MQGQYLEPEIMAYAMSQPILTAGMYVSTKFLQVMAKVQQNWITIQLNQIQ